MAKFILTGEGLESTLYILDENNDTTTPIHYPAGSDIDYHCWYGLPISAEGDLTVELQNNHTLHIAALNASYPVTFNIRGGTLMLYAVAPNVTCTFQTSKGAYQYKSPGSFGDAQFVSFGDINKLLETCEVVNDLFANGQTPVIEEMLLEQIGFIKNYKNLNSGLAIPSFIQQNNMIDASRVESFIDENLFDLSGFFKKAEETFLGAEGFHNDIDLSGREDRDGSDIIGDYSYGEI